MKYKTSIIALSLITALSSLAAPIVEVDRIVAIVNKGVITQQDLNRRITEALSNLKQRNITPPAKATLERQVLDQMITEEVLVQYAEMDGITISDADIDQAIDRLAERNKLNVESLYNQIQQKGITRDRFRQDIHRELMADKLRQREVDSRITVTDTEVEQALKSGTAASKAEYKIGAILISIPEKADENTINAKAAKTREALTALQKGQSFGQVSAKYSDAPNASKGGELGWRQGSALPGDLLQTMENMQIGDISEPIRTAEGFYIFKLIDRKSLGESHVVNQYHVQHILIGTNEAISEAAAKARIDKIRQDIMLGGNFEEMAKLYSEDGSNTRGGELGWINPGDTVPEFEQAMTTLPLNTISEPVRTPFGWHLIRVTETRKKDIAEDRITQSIKQKIREKKAEAAYIDWVNQLRGSMYVQDRLNEEK